MTPSEGEADAVPTGDELARAAEAHAAQTQAAEAQARAEAARARADELRRQLAEDEPGDVAEIDQAPPPRSRSLPWPAVGAGVAAAATVGLVVVTALMLWSHQKDSQQRQREAEFIAAARQNVVNLLAIDYNTAQDSVQRVLLLVSADLSHVHPAGVNPYPPNGAVAAAFDAAIGEWAAALDRDKLIVEAAALADDALSCGFTGMVLLEAALRASRGAPWAPRLLSGPSAPTYYGMVVAVFEATGAGT
jgi:hypothetical protein